ncbi:hypothetical protein EAI_14723 [Harpegnathos saltator]|uniref:Uncharacterized protein n=1 Tax=Harpegnathos saltator TaxID=610380 RepID=E2BV85_HARSA|nr:hypothetical protein EAI_14723 [Harpegnathos saltator]
MRSASSGDCHTATAEALLTHFYNVPTLYINLLFFGSGAISISQSARIYKYRSCAKCICTISSTTRKSNSECQISRYKTSKEETKGQITIIHPASLLRTYFFSIASAAKCLDDDTRRPFVCAAMENSCSSCLIRKTQRSEQIHSKDSEVLGFDPGNSESKDF